MARVIARVREGNGKGEIGIAVVFMGPLNGGKLGLREVNSLVHGVPRDAPRKAIP